MTGVILYGPPASGKDTITRELVALDSTYSLFARLKAGAGRTAGYRMTSLGEIDALRASGGVIWENARYGATYVVDAPGLHAAVSAGIPVLHLGQVDAVEAVRLATPEAYWRTIYLWCPRDVAVARIIERATGDVDERIAAYDRTETLDSAHLRIDTSEFEPAEAASAINRLVSE